MISPTTPGLYMITTTAALMASVVVIIYKPGGVGEIMFYSGLGLSLVAGALYIAAVKKRFFGREAGEERR